MIEFGAVVFDDEFNKDVVQQAGVPGSMTLREAELKATLDYQNAKINYLETDNAAMKDRLDKFEAEITELKAMVMALAAKQ